MSEPVLPSSIVFSNPLEVASPQAGTDPNAVDATSAPVQLGGIGKSWTTESATPGTTAQVVVSGENTQLTLGTGSADVNAIGGGSIVESVQLVDSLGNTIKDGSKAINLGDANVPYNNVPVKTDVLVTGNQAGQTVSISEAAGNQVPTGGFAFYAHGGTGDDKIIGSSFNDFIRGGAGEDQINSGAGNDLVRSGAGSDSIFLGTGSDTLFYTIDQIGAGDVDTLSDFTSGEDAIRIANDSGITFTLSSNGTEITFAAAGVTSTLKSTNGTAFTDVNFLS